MWNLPRPGIEPMFLALAGGSLTTEPPGKPKTWILRRYILKSEQSEPAILGKATDTICCQ